MRRTQQSLKEVVSERGENHELVEKTRKRKRSNVPKLRAVSKRWAGNCLWNLGMWQLLGDLDKSRLGSRSLIGQTSRKDEKEKNNK